METVWRPGGHRRRFRLARPYLEWPPEQALRLPRGNSNPAPFAHILVTRRPTKSADHAAASMTARRQILSPGPQRCAFMCGTRMPAFAMVMPLPAKTASKAAVYLLSRSRIRYFMAAPSSWRSMRGFWPVVWSTLLRGGRWRRRIRAHVPERKTGVSGQQPAPCHHHPRHSAPRPRKAIPPRYDHAPAHPSAPAPAGPGFSRQRRPWWLIW